MTLTLYFSIDSFLGGVQYLYFICSNTLVHGSIWLEAEESCQHLVQFSISGMNTSYRQIHHPLLILQMIKKKHPQSWLQACEKFKSQLCCWAMPGFFTHESCELVCLFQPIEPWMIYCCVRKLSFQSSQQVHTKNIMQPVHEHISLFFYRQLRKVLHC